MSSESSFEPNRFATTSQINFWSLSDLKIARDNEELEIGVRCMAAGIYDDQNQLVAGLSISAPADRLDESWLPKLQATASEISAALGYTSR